MRKYCQLDDASPALMRTAVSQLQLSARGFHRVLKLARTITDLLDAHLLMPTRLGNIFGAAEGCPHVRQGLAV